MGTTEPEVRAKSGDFPDWISAQLPNSFKKEVRVIDPAAAELPDPRSVEKLIITGSSSMVTDPSPSDTRAFEWLANVLAADVPVLGICYGHQMLGHVLGGKVGLLPGGPEIGLAQVSLEPAAKTDPIFKGCTDPQQVAVIHWQTILTLPDDATVLGRGARDPHQIVRFRPRVWGVQFHPEFNGPVMADYVRMCADDVRAQGQDPEPEAEAAALWHDKTEVIGRFAQLEL